MFTVPQYPITPEDFHHSLNSLMKIRVARILRNPRIKEDPKVICRSESYITGDAEEYSIPRAYHRVLLGFIREINFVAEDQIENPDCHFRAHYLIKVLDSFAEELKNPGDKESLKIRPSQFRSKVLNPILQRQRRGVKDNESTDVQSVVGNTVDDAHDFYLTSDPLYAEEGHLTLRNLVYLPSVRLSYLFLHAKCPQVNWEIYHKNTELLMTHRQEMRADDTWDDSILNAVEVKMIEEEESRHLYGKMLPDPVRILAIWFSEHFQHF